MASPSSLGPSRHWSRSSSRSAQGPTSSPDSVYLAFPAFRLYAEKGQGVLRQIIGSALRHLLPEPSLQTSLPSQGLQSAQRQAAKRRTVLHLLYASPIRRGKDIEVIEDIVPLQNLRVRFSSAQKIARAVLEPQGQPLEFTQNKGWIETTLPELNCHQMIVLEDA